MGKFENELSTTIDAILNALGYSPLSSQKQEQASLSSPYFAYKSNQRHVPGVYGSTHLLGVSPVIHEPPLMSPWIDPRGNTRSRFAICTSRVPFLNLLLTVSLIRLTVNLQMRSPFKATLNSNGSPFDFALFFTCLGCYFNFLWSNGISTWNFKIPRRIDAFFLAFDCWQFLSFGYLLIFCFLQSNFSHSLKTLAASEQALGMKWEM